ncbi:fluoride efflux transporter FluC [Halobaculum sp. EA56]|uniref:fluoride efflux transporter FluC n=1 Tax=Halobaculum sp. EA56 TaxID=3421648 RepID=UPI003EBD8E60
MVDRHPLVALETVVLVAMGGALGANARYGVGLLVPGLGGTLAANVTGCYLLGVLVYEGRYTGVLADRSRVLIGTGFLSSYTTYSTFALETVRSAPAVAVGYVAVSYALGFAAVLAGRATARRIPAAPTPTGGE